MEKFSNMDCEGEKFKVTFSMKDEDGTLVLCKKEPRGRFKRLKTVKLIKDHMYQMFITFQPPKTLESVFIEGSMVELYEKSRDSKSSVYSVVLSTRGMIASKDSYRRYLPVILKVWGAKELMTVLQIKVYKDSKGYHSSGDSVLHYMALDFDPIQSNCVEHVVCDDGDYTVGCGDGGGGDFSGGDLSGGDFSSSDCGSWVGGGSDSGGGGCDSSGGASDSGGGSCDSGGGDSGGGSCD